MTAETDLISRQAALNTFNCSIGGVPVDSVKYVKEYSDKMIAKLKLLPSAQPEIIRCKDCLIHGICRLEQWLGLDGYCSRAERRVYDEDR